MVGLRKAVVVVAMAVLAFAPTVQARPLVPVVLHQVVKTYDGKRTFLCNGLDNVKAPVYLRVRSYIVHPNGEYNIRFYLNDRGGKRFVWSEYHRVIVKKPNQQIVDILQWLRSAGRFELETHVLGGPSASCHIRVHR